MFKGLESYSKAWLTEMDIAFIKSKSKWEKRKDNLQSAA